MGYKRVLILTGAGFSYNFGGFLASEMRARIFNYPPIQRQGRVRDLILHTDGFENVIAQVFKEPSPGDETPFTEEEKATLNEAVERAYQDLDENIRGWGISHSHSVGPSSLESLVNRANSGQTSISAFFTLNQDILMERNCGKHSLGATRFNDMIYWNPNWLFAKKDFVQMPDAEALKPIKDNLVNENNMYLKLHGSYGWVSNDGESRMVIGGEKSDQIKKEPLLAWYLELFEQAVKSGDKRLLIVGYSFGDSHINQIIEAGCREHGLELYIINPHDPRQFWIGLHSMASVESNKENIRNRMRGYFPYTYAQIFSERSDRPNIYFQEISEALAA